MATPHQPSAHCPHCGAEVQTPGVPCWLCREKASHSDPNPYAPPRPIAGENAAAQFSLASLFLVMTLVAVGLGLFMLAPGLGVLFAFVATPALIRTTVAASRRRQAGAPLSTTDKVAVFLTSWFLMGAVGVASVVAFMAVCVAGALITESAGGSIETTLLVGALGGLATALPVAGWLLRLTSPARMESAPPRDPR